MTDTTTTTTSKYDLSATFVCQDLDPDTFEVLSFEGEEAISSPFLFRLRLLSENANIDLPTLVGQAATFEITYDGTTRTIHGIVGEADQGDPFLARRYLYELTLVPRIAALGLSRGFQIHLGRTTPEIVAAELTATNRKGLKDMPQFRLTDRDFTVSLKADYPKWDYRCQYDETDLAFISRLMEYEGMFYYFTHKEGFDKVVIGDDKIFLYGAEHDLSCEYQRGDLNPYLERIYSFRRRQRRIPEHVAVNDYNYATPALRLLETATADPEGTGAVHAFGDHHLTNDDGTRLASVRAEAEAVRKATYEGSGHHILFEAGRLFTLSAHFRDDLNRNYRIVSVRHRGRLRVAGAEGAAGPDAGPFGYHNTFTCIWQTTQFRPQRVTPVPKVDGLVSAHVDSESEGYQADVDDQGRYLLRMPFDLSGRPDGKASARVRLASPLSGSSEGIHFPLRKGTEVLVAHVLGDPDRPVIVAAVPNPGTQSTVTSANAASAVYATASGMRVAFQDNPGVVTPITHVPPPPDTTSTITPSGSSGGGSSDGGSSNGTASGGTAGAGARSLGAAATPVPEARTLSAAASSSAPAADDCSDHVTDQDKSFQVSIPDYKSGDGSETYSTYMRLGGTPSKTITVNGKKQDNPNYEIEVSRLKKAFGISESDAEKTLSNDTLGWFDFTDGGRVSLTEGYVADRVHDGSMTYSIEYATTADAGTSWSHRLVEFDLETKVALYSTDFFVGAKIDAAAGVAVDLSVTAETEMAGGTKCGLVAGFQSEVGFSAKYERMCGPETLDVHTGSFEQTARSITLTAGSIAQASDKIQTQAFHGIAATAGVSAAAGVAAATVTAAADHSPISSEELLTTPEKGVLVGAKAFSSGLLAGAVAGNIGMVASYAAVKTALKAETVENPPQISLSETGRSVTLSSGESSIRLGSTGITMSFGETSITIDGQGVRLSTEGRLFMSVAGSTMAIRDTGLSVTAPKLNLTGEDQVFMFGGAITVSADGETVMISGQEVMANAITLAGG